MFLRIILLVAAVGAYPGGYLDDNKFEATRGCLQLNANIGFGANHPFYRMAQFRNVHISNNTTIMRMGVLGDRNAYIRLSGTSDYPTLIHEIVISHTVDCETFLQRYVRTAPNKIDGFSAFKKITTKEWMSFYEPLMFTVEITENGRITVTRDYEHEPFIEEHDPTIDSSYIAFVNWATNEKTIFFIDCPLRY